MINLHAHQAQARHMHQAEARRMHQAEARHMLRPGTTCHAPRSQAARSGSRERRRRSSPRGAEYWTRHYSEKFGLDDGDTGRGGGKGVDEWARYYEQKYGLSK